MSIPINQLYHYIQSVAMEIHKDHVTVFFFYPHGSRDINNLTTLQKLSEYEIYLCPEIYCNDQEPLNYDLYKDKQTPIRPILLSQEVLEVLARKNITFPNLNFRGTVLSIWDQALLLHSEKRSSQIDQYQASQFIPVYYWSHAVIARDWFRYAQHVNQRKQVKKTFLIYNRAWSGTREYRLRFAELLINSGLQDLCQTNINPIEPELGLHYNNHKFVNSVWRPQTVLEDYFLPSSASSNHSAEFCMEDYENTDIEVVLETLFDDSRLFLTEKILRPMACAQPFILASTPGSLEYLRSYGFQTFGNQWDESYDQILDPHQRLQAIVQVMKQIANWSPELREKNMAQAQIIAEHNRQHFFSTEFFDHVINELKTNLSRAFVELKNINRASAFIHRYNTFRSDPELLSLIKPNKTQETLELMINAARQYNKNF